MHERKAKISVSTMLSKCSPNDFEVIRCGMASTMNHFSSAEHVSKGTIGLRLEHGIILMAFHLLQEKGLICIMYHSICNYRIA